MQLKDPQLLRQQCYIDGAWVDAAGGERQSVTNPATGETLAHVPTMGAADTKRAIDAAARAFGPWSKLTAKERGGRLRRWFELMMANQDDLATLMTAEQGKPLAESKGEIAYAASFIEWYAEEGKRVNAESVTSHLPGAEMIVRREALGVVGVVTPWNFPSAMLTRKAGAALAVLL